MHVLSHWVSCPMEPRFNVCSQVLTSGSIMCPCRVGVVRVSKGNGVMSGANAKGGAGGR